MKDRNILLIEDDPLFAKIISRFLAKHDYNLTHYASVSSAKSAIDNDNFNAIILDYQLPDGSGEDILDYIKEKNILHSHPTIIMTSFHDVKTAVNCIKKGAVDYITKPIQQDELLHILEQALPSNQIHKKLETIDNPISNNTSFIIGSHTETVELYEHIKVVGPTELSVLINGESGTGKEHVARLIHEYSNRKSGPFIAIDCGALSNELAASELFGHKKGAFTGALNDYNGKIMEADGGTLFLDEIGNLSYDIQIKLLRTLQERTITPLGSNSTIPVNVRIVSATNETFEKNIAEDKFRLDLFHRINEFTLYTIPLRQRVNDIETLSYFFIEKSNIELNKNVQHIAPAVKHIFQQYQWPGNIRELKNIIRRAVLLSTIDTIQENVLPRELIHFQDKTQNNPYDLKNHQMNLEKELIINSLKKYKFNKSKVAIALNIDRSTLYNKMAKYNIIEEEL